MLVLLNTVNAQMFTLLTQERHPDPVESDVLKCIIPYVHLCESTSLINSENEPCRWK